MPAYVSCMSARWSQHVGVLVEEVVSWLVPASGKTFLDGTFGGGGHTLALAPRVAPGGLVIALDRDAAAVRTALPHLAGLPVKLVWSNFDRIGEVLAELGVDQVDGILLDLGLSSDQLADQERGFSFDSAGDLDLRFDTSRGLPAWKLIERMPAQKLADMIYRYGEERLSRRIARRIVESRARSPIRTAAELARIVRSCVPRRSSLKIDPATRTFQALRIAVNNEIDALDTILRQGPDLLRPGGRMAVISFHSLEDRPVKQAFRDDPRLTVLTRKPIRPSDQEIARNPRAKSAKLRVAEKRGEPCSGAPHPVN